MTVKIDETLEPFIVAAMGRKAKDIMALDVSELTSYADVMIIASGTSSRQVTAIAEYIKAELVKKDIHPLSVEGIREGLWVLMDYGHVIIHVFYEETRTHYDIEGLWADARRLDVEHLNPEPETHD